MQLTSGHIFSGGGGDTEGAIAAGYKPLWGVESDKYAAAVYRHRFPDTQLIEADARDLSDNFIQSLPVPALISFGSPCPDFSYSGDGAGLKGNRGSLFFAGLRFLRLQEPPVFIFENVDGLLATNNGADIKTIINAFGQLGYLGTWQVRDGGRWVPQTRRRLFCVGYHWKYSELENCAR